jgi:hypothetical protein
MLSPTLTNIYDGNIIIETRLLIYAIFKKTHLGRTKGLGVQKSGSGL